MDRNEISTRYREPPIDASYQVLVHLAKQFQRRGILKISQSETSRLWRPCLLTDRDEMSNLYREHSIDASYHVSVHLVMRFHRRRFFKNSANQKQELPVVTMFVNGSGQDVQPLERTFHKCFLPSFRDQIEKQTRCSRGFWVDRLSHKVTYGLDEWLS